MLRSSALLGLSEPITAGPVLVQQPAAAKRTNNFDIVRLSLALIVVVSHCCYLSGSPSLAGISLRLDPSPAVQGFFAISGYLIFASYERCRTIREYAVHRALRILPGYYLSTVVCLAIAFAVGSHAIGKFLLANLTFMNFLHPNIPGVFDSNPGNNAMNGALWTIKVEILFYLSVPIIVWLARRWNRDALLIALFVGSLVFRYAYAGNERIDIQLPGQLCFFMIGTLIYYHAAAFKRYGVWTVLAAALLLVIHPSMDWFWARALAIPILTLGACLLLPHITGPTRWGDFSYGTYILHYPIVQLLVAVGLYRWQPWGALALTFAAVAVAASFSWFVVEKPSLTRAKAYGKTLHA